MEELKAELEALNIELKSIRDRTKTTGKLDYDTFNELKFEYEVVQLRLNTVQMQMQSLTLADNAKAITG